MKRTELQTKAWAAMAVTTRARMAMAVIAVTMLAACGEKYDDSAVRGEIDALKERVTTLEEASAALKARLDAGVSSSR